MGAQVDDAAGMEMRNKHRVLQMSETRLGRLLKFMP